MLQPVDLRKHLVRLASEIGSMLQVLKEFSQVIIVVCLIRRWLLLGPTIMRNSVTPLVKHNNNTITLMIGVKIWLTRYIHYQCMDIKVDDNIIIKLTYFDTKINMSK